MERRVVITGLGAITPIGNYKTKIARWISKCGVFARTWVY